MPLFYSLWHSFSKTDWQVKEETFFLFLTCLLWVPLLPPSVFLRGEHSHGLSHPKCCQSLQTRGAIWNKHSRIRGVPGPQSCPLALRLVSANWIELDHLQWLSDLSPEEFELMENLSVCVTCFVLAPARTARVALGCHSLSKLDGSIQHASFLSLAVDHLCPL